MVHYHLLLANWPSLWCTTIFYLTTGHPYGASSVFNWHTGYHYGTQPSSTHTLAVSMVHYYLLLANDPLYDTHPSSIGPLTLPVVHYHLLLAQLPIPMVHYHFLLAHWLSPRYTPISYWPIGCFYGTLLSSTGPLALPIVHNYLLQTPTCLCGTLLSSTGPLAFFIVHYHLLLALWLPLWYITTFYWPTGYLYGTIQSSSVPLVISMVHYHLLLVHWLSLYHTTFFFYWLTGYFYGTLLFSIGTLSSSTGQLALPMVHCHLLLANRPSPWYSTIFYLPTGHPYGTPSIFYRHTGYLYGTLPSTSSVSMVDYYLLLAHWPSLCYSIIFYWPSDSLYGTLPCFLGQVAPSYVTLPFSTGPPFVYMDSI